MRAATNKPFIEPFRIAVPDADISDLRDRLARTRWPDAGAGAWADGTDLEYLKTLVDYWREDFDWRCIEARINEHTQIRVRCDGVTVHAVHLRGEGPAPFPIVMTHGWPGSFLELIEVAKRLAHPRAYGADASDAFHVVIPSLPGFGFSERPPGGGFEPKSIAPLWLALMTALGYERFGAQGGDWGAGVSTEIALAAPQRVLGVHLNFMMRGYLLGPKQQVAFEPDELAFFADADRFAEEEGAYAHLHATKPQSLAYGLNDSPAGLAAWIVEKFRTWTDCDGDIERAVSRDDLLANVSLYWYAQTIGSSMRIYRNRRLAPPSPPATPPSVPFAFAAFPKELLLPPKRLIARSFKLESYSVMPRGGHFAALEQPELLANDVRAFFRSFR